MSSNENHSPMGLCENLQLYHP